MTNPERLHELNDQLTRKLAERGWEPAVDADYDLLDDLTHKVAAIDRQTDELIDALLAGNPMTATPAPATNITDSSPAHVASTWCSNNFNADAEDCNACNELEDLCPIHLGINKGIEYVAHKLGLLAEDPEQLDFITEEKQAH